MNPSTNRRLKPTIVAAALLALGSLPGLAADSSIAFTLTGTATRGVCGYIFGESYAFTWVLNGDFADNANSFFAGTLNDWCEDLVSETPLYSDVSGDGLTGTWQRPAAAPADRRPFPRKRGSASRSGWRKNNENCAVALDLDLGCVSDGGEGRCRKGVRRGVPG